MTFETSLARVAKNDPSHENGGLESFDSIVFLSLSFFFLFQFLHVCAVHGYVCAYIYMYLGTRVWYAYICADRDPSWCPGSSSIACLLNHWGKVSQSAQDSPIWSASLISLLWGIPRFCLPRLELWVSHCVFLPLT